MTCGVEPTVGAGLGAPAGGLLDVACSTTGAARCDSVSMDVLRGVEGAGADFGDPRFAHAASEAWQEEQARALADALGRRGVPIWTGELPPELLGHQTRATP